MESRSTASARASPPVDRLPGSGRMFERPMAFSRDSKVFLAPCGAAVRVQGFSSAEPLGFLSGHTSTVTAVCRNPANRFQALTASLDGSIRLWDYLEGTCLMTWRVVRRPGAVGPLPIHHMLVGARPEPAEGEDRAPDFELYVSVAWKKKNRKQGRNSKAVGTSASTWLYRVGSVRLSMDGAGSSNGPPAVPLQNLFKIKVNKGSPHFLSLNPTNSALAAAAGRVIIVCPVGMDNTVDQGGVEGGAAGAGAYVEKNGDIVGDNIGETGGIVRRTCSKRVTSLAFHPQDGYLATGDEDGRITVWYDIASPKFITSSLHWHAHPVRALTFSTDGVYLFSGGDEAVLVAWQLEFKRKTFLPRLGGVIRQIAVAPDGNRYVVSLGDNSIRVIDAVTSRVSLTIRGLAVSTSTSQDPPRLRIDPRDGVLVTLGAPGNLQFYDVTEKGRHVAELNVAQRPAISRSERKIKLKKSRGGADGVLSVPDRIDIWEFDSTGQWLATVEHSRRQYPAQFSATACENSSTKSPGESPALPVTPPPPTPCPCKLKIWRRHPSSSEFELSATIRNPHPSRVVASAFAPQRAGDDTPPVLATLAIDGSFKLWTPSDGSRASGWVEANAGFYRGEYTDYESRDLAFSGDGSLLAVSYGRIVTLWGVTLWGTRTLKLKRTVALGSAQQDDGRENIINSVEFVGRYLVAASATRLGAWDLISMRPVFEHAAPVASPITVEQSVRGGGLAPSASAPRRFSVAVAAPRGVAPRGASLRGRKGLIVVEFDVESAKPTGIRVAGDAGTKLSLVYCPGLFRADGEGPTTEAPCLIYANRANELVRIPGFSMGFDGATTTPVVSATAQSATAQSAATAMASTPTAFERIYGQATPTSPAQPSSTPMENKISASNAGAGAVALFDGPSHVLQAVESLYDPFMRALLSGPAQRTEQKHAIRRSLGGGTHLRKRKRDGDSAGADPDTTQVDSDVAMPSGGTSVETARDFAFAAEDERVFAMDTMEGLFQWDAQKYVDILQSPTASQTPKAKPKRARSAKKQQTPSKPASQGRSSQGRSSAGKKKKTPSSQRRKSSRRSMRVASAR